MSTLNPRRSLFLLIALSLALLLWIQIPKFGDEFRVDEDFRSFYWMRKFRDPALFPDDPLRNKNYVSVPVPEGDLPILVLHSPGYGLLFYIASFFVTPILFSKLIPMLLLPISVWYLFKYGQSVGNAGLGATLVIGFVLLNLVSATSLAITSGLQRSFSIPLMIVLVYYLHRRQNLPIVLVLILAALIYAPIFMLGLITWGLFILEWTPGSPPFVSVSRKEFVLLLLTFVLGAAILSPILVSQFAQGFSDEGSVTLEDHSTTPDQPLWERPTYSAGGRHPLFSIFPLVGRAGLVTKARNGLYIMLLVLVSTLIVLVLGRQAFKLPSEIWCTLGAGAIAFAISWSGILLTDSLLLYEPSRFSRVSLYLFLMMFVLLNGERFFKATISATRLQRDKLLWLLIGLEAIAFGLILFYPAERSTLDGFNLKWVLAPAAILLGALSIVALNRPAKLAPRRSVSTLSPVVRVFLGGIAAIGLIGWLIYARQLSRSSLLNPPPAERELLAFLETLPRDDLVAGTPCALDNVPLLSGRQVLFSCEQPSSDSELTRIALNAYYSDDPQTVLDFCDSYGVDFLVIHREAYSDAYIEEGEIFYAPYNDPLLDYIADQDGFVLPQAAEELSIFESGPYRVIPCSALRTVEP